MRDKLLAARKLEDWSRMSTVISHEIANPLEAIQNILYLLKNDANATEDTAQLAAQATQEIARVITISNSTLSFHRESARPESVDLRVVIESVRYMLRRIVTEKGIDLRITGDGDFSVEAYPGETRQVVLNLVRNACEATRQGSRVSLNLFRVPLGVELYVSDQGPGIDPAILPTLFEFGQSTKGSQGNGLGLWTVKQIVTKHNGRIILDHTYREGARFVVFWPKTFSGSRAAARHPELAPV